MTILSEIKPILLVITLAIGAFSLTRSPWTSPFALVITIGFLLIFIGYLIYKTRWKGTAVDKTSAVLGSFTILALVGTTGWFYSPFFFALYLLAILFAFLFSPTVAFVFVVTLVVLFAFNVGEVDLVYDLMIVLSLLTVVPLSFYLRKKYLDLREAAKEILILEKEKKEYKNKVEEVLANTVTKIVVDLRQPVNDIRMMAHRLDKEKTKEAREKDKQRIITASEETLRKLDTFEKDATGEGMVRG